MHVMRLVAFSLLAIGLTVGVASGSAKTAGGSLSVEGGRGLVQITGYVPGGKYQVVARGTDISISARGSGSITLDGDPDAVGDTGMYAIGDDTPIPLPPETTKTTFGPTDPSTPSAP
jgi:hypothetical protein